MYYLQSKYLWSALLICWLFSAASCHDNKLDPYNESDYREVRKGKYRGTDLYALVLQNERDTQYTLVKVFGDSTYNTNFYVQHFEYNGLIDGPMQSFISGKAGNKQLYKEGKRHGEEVSYGEDSSLAERRFYDSGKKVGVWEFYDSFGRLFKKKYYNNNKFTKQEIYNRGGKLVRTEFEESTTY